MRKDAFSIVALSDLFTPLASASFQKRHTQNMQRWLTKIAETFDEPRIWFFDELEMQRYRPPLQFFEQFEYSQFYLVNHRFLNEIIDAFHDYALLVNGKTEHNGRAFFLASARRLLSGKHIYYYDLELEKIF